MMFYEKLAWQPLANIIKSYFSAAILLSDDYFASWRCWMFAEDNIKTVICNINNLFQQTISQINRLNFSWERENNSR